MTRTRYIIFKENVYFPAEAYDDVQKRKAAMKYNLVNVLHPLFLLLVMLLMLLPLLAYPDRKEIMEHCNEIGKPWNPYNQTWNATEEEHAWYPYAHFARAYDDVDQLKQYYSRRVNATAMFNTTTDTDVVYYVYDTKDITAAEDVLLPAMNKAYAEWEAGFKGLRDCAKEYVHVGDAASIKTMALIFIILYSAIFLFSLCAREIFIHNYVKKEYTEAEWKRESHNNTFFIGLWLFISLLFVAYLVWLPDRREAYLNGILGRYWTI